MPFQIVYGDITKIKADAIVNAANSSLLGGGGVDGCIHRAAGPELLNECRTLGGCSTGDAKITKGYNLPAKYVIHTVGPVWYGGNNGEKDALQSCYRRSLELAVEYGCESVTFPLISAGVYGYPKIEARKIATKTITDFLAGENIELDVKLVIFSKNDFEADEDLTRRITVFLNRFATPVYQSQAVCSEPYCNQSQPLYSAPCCNQSYAPLQHAAPAPQSTKEKKKLFSRKKENKVSEAKKRPAIDDSTIDKGQILYDTGALPPELSKFLKREELDESFQEMLLRKIDEIGISDVECYKNANISRKHFSKIRSDAHYSPKKSTALCFAISLRLSVEETNELLKKAGYTLSDSCIDDKIVKYFILNSSYNIHDINDALVQFDRPTLGMPMD